MNRRLAYLPFKIVRNYTNTNDNPKLFVAKCGILSVRIRSQIRIQNFLEKLDSDP
jgi:hypothetical protein